MVGVHGWIQLSLQGVSTFEDANLRTTVVPGKKATDEAQILIIRTSRARGPSLPDAVQSDDVLLHAA